MCGDADGDGGGDVGDPTLGYGCYFCVDTRGDCAEDSTVEVGVVRRGGGMLLVGRMERGGEVGGGFIVRSA